MQGMGTVIGKKAPEFELLDHEGHKTVLSETLQKSPVLLAFYPGDFTPVCTKQLCNYKDSIREFQEFGLEILGISSNTIERHKEFEAKYEFPFKLLSDPNGKIAKAYGCTSRLMFGNLSRAVFIINKMGIILYRYVEPTILTRRKAEELIGILQDLRTNGIL
jgi:thioredoxin-dependent peroxiredoxin